MHTTQLVNHIYGKIFHLIDIVTYFVLWGRAHKPCETLKS